MKNLKTLLGFGILMSALMVNTTFAGTGIMISDVAQKGGCMSTDSSDDQNESSSIGVLFGDVQSFLFGDDTECGDDSSVQGIMISD